MEMPEGGRKNNGEESELIGALIMHSSFTFSLNKVVRCSFKMANKLRLIKIIFML